MNKLQILVIVVALQATSLFADERAVVTYRDSGAEVSKHGGSWNKIKKGSIVSSGDKIKTDDNAKVEISIDGLSVIRLAPKTTLNVSKLFDEHGKKVKTDIVVEEGEIWSNTEKLTKDLEFDVNTDVAGMAIKGTIFRVIKKDNGNTKLKVYRGRVDIEAKSSSIAPPKIEIGQPKQISGPKEVSLETWLEVIENMQEIEVSKDGMILFKREFDFTSAEDTTHWSRWNKRRDRVLQKNRLIKKAEKLKKKMKSR